LHVVDGDSLVAVKGEHAGEDSLALDVRPRIEAAGGDVSKVYYPEFIPRLPTEVKLLQKWAEELGAVGLIVLDPISGMIPGRCDSHRDSDVRPVISPLNDLADQLQCLVVGVRHLRKDASGGALESVLGSIDWVNVPRAVIAIVRDKFDDIRYVQVVAGNRAPMGSESRGFRIVGADVVPGGEPVAKAVFIDGPGKDVDDLLDEATPKDNSSKTMQAAIRILDILENANGEGLKQDDVFSTVAQELSIVGSDREAKGLFRQRHVARPRTGEGIQTDGQKRRMVRQAKRPAATTPVFMKNQPKNHQRVTSIPEQRHKVTLSHTYKGTMTKNDYKCCFHVRVRACAREKAGDN